MPNYILNYTTDTLCRTKWLKMIPFRATGLFNHPTPPHPIVFYQFIPIWEVLPRLGKLLRISSIIVCFLLWSFILHHLCAVDKGRQKLKTFLNFPETQLDKHARNTDGKKNCSTTIRANFNSRFFFLEAALIFIAAETSVIRIGL